MSIRNEQKGENEWVCAKCDIELEPAKAQITYMGYGFTIDVLECPRCHIILVTEDMAVNKMAEAEKALEDK